MQSSQENTFAIDSFLVKLQAWGLQLYWKETLAKVFSCEFCKIFQNTSARLLLGFTDTITMIWNAIFTIAQKMKFSIKDFFCKCDLYKITIHYEFDAESKRSKEAIRILEQGV